MSVAQDPEHQTVVDTASFAKKTRAQRWRLAALAVLFVGSLVLVHVTGIAEEKVDVAFMRSFVDRAGVWGVFAYLVAFALGVLVQLPGIAFVAAASVAYGEVLGIPVAYAGAMGAATTSFVIVRAIGGQPLRDVRKPWMRKVLARLEAHPVATIAVLRLLFFLSPAVNYTLAMSAVRLRDYLVGSAIGAIPWVLGVVPLFDWIAAEYLSL